ncbi:MAG: hypothetical protein HYV63_09345 [Candidatus Schekmanbacteria bacterium]|nr:hypothetical protein [Candidatus Schekmanbacteria bacterium]
MCTEDEYTIEDLLKIIYILSWDFPEIADSHEVADLIPKVCGMPDGSAKLGGAEYLQQIVTGKRWDGLPCYHATYSDCASHPAVYPCPSPASRPGPAAGAGP